MSGYLPESNSYSVSSVLVSPLQQEQVQYDHLLTTGIIRSLDTVENAQKKQRQKQQTAGARPTLAQPGKSKNPDYLAILAHAFSKAFDSMAEGAIAQTKNYADLQEFDETMSQCVLQSTNIAITKQQKQIKLAAEVQAYQMKIQRADAILGYVLLGIGIVVTVVSLGISAAAEFPLLAAGVGEEIGDGMGDAIELDTFSDLSESDPIEMEEEEDPINNPNNTDNPVNNNPTEVENANNSEESAKKRILKWLGRKTLHMAASVGFGSPMLINGIEGLKTAEMLNQVAKAQLEVGNALSIMQTNNMYFQFYQQLLQLSGGVAREETNDASQVVETFSDITSGYKQITNGLASAV